MGTQDGRHGPGRHGDPGAQEPTRRRTLFAPEDFLGDFIAAPDAVLADIGCGTGFFALPAARMLSAGRVLAVDIQQESLDRLAASARQEGLANVEAIRADAAALPLSANSVALVLMARFLLSYPERDAILHEARRVLRPGGRLYLVQWDRVPTPMGPPFALRIGQDAIAGIVERAGFAVLRLWPGPAPFYRVLAQKPEA